MQEAEKGQERLRKRGLLPPFSLSTSGSDESLLPLLLLPYMCTTKDCVRKQAPLLFGVCSLSYFCLSPFILSSLVDHKMCHLTSVPLAKSILSAPFPLPLINFRKLTLTAS